MASYDDTATVSGSVVAFSDGADGVPLKNWLVTLPASLDGYTAVNGKMARKNLLNTSYFSNMPTSYTINQDGSITVIASENSAWTTLPTMFLKAGTYTLSRQLTGSTCYIRTSIDNYASNALAIYNARTEASFMLADDAYIKVKLGTSGTYPFTDKYQLEVGSSASAWEAYTAPTTYTASLGRTIYGGKVDVVNGQGTETHGKLTLTPGMINNAISYTYQNKVGVQIANVFPVDVIRQTDNLCYVDNGDNTGYFVPVRQGASSDADYMWFGSASGNKYLYWIGVLDTMGMTLEQWKTWALSQTIICVYELATPTDFTITPITPTPETALGVNNFWADEGDSEITYYKSGYGFTSVTIHKETPEGEPVEETRKLHRIIYEGQVDVINGTGLIYRGESGTQYDPPEQISFTPIEIATDEGENTLYADQGDSAITYRKAVD